MNALKPGDNPKIRQCYTCAENNPAPAPKRSGAPAAPVEDELTLMPNEGEDLGGQRKGRMAPRKTTRPPHQRPKFGRP